MKNKKPTTSNSEKPKYTQPNFTIRFDNRDRDLEILRKEFKKRKFNFIIEDIIKECFKKKSNQKKLECLIDVRTEYLRLDTKYPKCMSAFFFPDVISRNFLDLINNEIKSLIIKIKYNIESEKILTEKPKPITKVVIVKTTKQDKIKWLGSPDNLKKSFELLIKYKLIKKIEDIEKYLANFIDENSNRLIRRKRPVKIDWQKSKEMLSILLKELESKKLLDDFRKSHVWTKAGLIFKIKGKTINGRDLSTSYYNFQKRYSPNEDKVINKQIISKIIEQLK